MRYLALALAILVLGLAAEAKQENGRPDFSGRWVAVSDGGPTLSSQPDEKTPTMKVKRPESPATLGKEFIAAQDEKTLTLERKAGSVTVRTVYRFDRESKNLEGFVETISVATWRGQVLEISTRLSEAPSGSVDELRRRLWLNSDKTLAVETSDGHGTVVSNYRRSVDGVLLAGPGGYSPFPVAR